MNDEKPQNPSAFPEITLRDYFAAKAMQAVINTEHYTFTDIAEMAYDIADAMLKQREK